MPGGVQEHQAADYHEAQCLTRSAPAESAAPPSLRESKGTIFGKTTTNFTPRMQGPSSPTPASSSTQASTSRSRRESVVLPTPAPHRASVRLRRTISIPARLPPPPSIFTSLTLPLLRPPRSRFPHRGPGCGRAERRLHPPRGFLSPLSRPGLSPCVPRRLHCPLRPHRRPGLRAQARARALRPCSPRCPSARMYPPTSPVTNERNTTTSRSRRSPRAPLPFIPPFPSTLRGSAPRSSTPTPTPMKKSRTRPSPPRRARRIAKDTSAGTASSPLNPKLRPSWTRIPPHTSPSPDLIILSTSTSRSLAQPAQWRP
ncbi:hypothetical protein DFH09DRAFT_570864 [Mycena vulgaris]|nr:hypothetical protein DFH09DRAFT_570864 [Mycena vulgaris]